LMFVTFDPDMDDKEFRDERDEIESYLEDLDHSGEWISQDFSSMGFSSDELSYSFYSDNLNDLNETLKEAEKALEDVDHIKDVSTSAEDVFVEHVLEADQNELIQLGLTTGQIAMLLSNQNAKDVLTTIDRDNRRVERSEEHTSELQSRFDLVCRLLLEKKKT